MVLALALLVLGDVHGDALHDLAFRSTDDRVAHAHQLAIGVDEDGRGRVDDAWDERGLDQLEVELLGRVVAEDGAFVAEVQLEEVGDAEGLGVDALGGQGTHVMVVTSVLAEEASAGRACALAGNLELQNQLFRLSSAAQEEVLLVVSTCHAVLPPALVKLDLRLVGDLQAAGVSALGVVDVDHQVSHLSGQEEALGHDDGHLGGLAANESDLLGERNGNVELGIVHDWAHRRDVDSLAVTNFALAPLVVEEVGADGHELDLEEVSQLDAQLGPPLVEVDGLGQVGGHLESEWDGDLSGVADIVLEAVEHLVLLPHAALPDVGISLAFVAVVDLLAGVDELELELDAVGGDGRVGVNVDDARDRVLGVEGALVTLESDVHAHAVKRRFLGSHAVLF